MKNKKICLRKRRWDILNDFENKYKERFLRRLSEKESLEIYKNLYQFAQGIIDKDEYKKLNLRRIQALSKVHFMFMKVK